jgi:hypothetical protein
MESVGGLVWAVDPAAAYHAYVRRTVSTLEAQRGEAPDSRRMHEAQQGGWVLPPLQPPPNIIRV